MRKKTKRTKKIETKTLDTKPPDQLKKEVFINDPLPPQFKASKCPSPEFFYVSKPDQPERMAGDMKSKALVLPEVISATNDIFTLCKVQIHGQPEVVETENAECAIFLK